MKYISLIHALNLPCKLDTCGDWHCSALNWENPKILESKDSVFGDYGIEKDKVIPEHKERYNVANHIRAILDLLYMGNFTVAQGMNKDYISNDKYNKEIFEKILLMSNLPHFDKIDKFMTKEYLSKWVDFKKEKINYKKQKNH